MTIEERFERLEREYQEFKEKAEKRSSGQRRLTLASIALALAALIGGTALSVRAYTAAIEPVLITTQTIILKDANGRERIRLTGAAGAITAYDANGKLRSYLGSNGQVRAFDANGVPRVLVNAERNNIHFYNASGGQVAAHP